jgi:hypothetical protein
MGARSLGASPQDEGPRGSGSTSGSTTVLHSCKPLARLPRPEPEERVAGPEHPGRLAASDIDDDGELEIVAMEQGQLLVFEHVGATLVQGASVPLAIMDGFQGSWCLGDVNDDERMDLLSLTRQTERGLWVHPLGAAEHARDVAGYEVGIGENVSCAVGDFNNDGRGDVAIAEDMFGYEDRAWVMAQTPSGTLGTPMLVSTYGWSGGVAASDLNLDGRDDLVRIHSMKLSILLQGDDGLNAPSYYSYADGSSESDRALALGDVNCDGCPDIVAANVTGLVLFYGQGCASR